MGWTFFHREPSLARLQYQEGDREPCYCGKPINSLTGNPGEWPVALCHADDPGKVKYHHAACVTDRLDAKAALLARLREPDDALVDAVARGIHAYESMHEWFDLEPEEMHYKRQKVRAALIKIVEMLT